MLTSTLPQNLQAALAGNEAWLRTYFNDASDGLFCVRIEPSGDFLYEAMNPAGLAQAGKSLEMVKNRTPEDVLGTAAGRIITAALRMVRDTGASYRYESSFHTGTGETIYDVICLPLRNAEGEMTGILGCARDITALRERQVTSGQAEKMEALRQLAVRTAHDFNNVAAGVLSCLELLAKRIDTPREKAMIEECRLTVERGTALVSHLRAFSRQEPLGLQSVDFNLVLAHMADTLAFTLGPGVRITTDLQPGLWPAIADYNQIELAILNIIINARDAMPRGGTLHIKTRNQTKPAPTALAAGDYVTITLTDTGSGMTPDVLARATDPLFTKKDQNTGLGLSIVNALMRELGGRLELASEPGKGTSVTLSFPRATATS